MACRVDRSPFTVVLFRIFLYSLLQTMFPAVVKSSRVSPTARRQTPCKGGGGNYISADPKQISDHVSHCRAREGGHNSQHPPSHERNHHVRAQEDGHTHQGGQAQRCIISEPQQETSKTYRKFVTAKCF